MIHSWKFVLYLGIGQHSGFRFSLGGRGGPILRSIDA